MGSEQNLTANSLDAYAHQKMYEEKKYKSKLILSWVFVALSIASLVMALVMPVYEYNHRNKKTQYRIEGEFTLPKMVTEFFDGGLGEGVGLLNTLAMVSAVLVLVCMVYLAISTLLAALFRGKLTGIANTLTSYGVIELVSTLQFVFLMMNVIAARVDVSGELKNQPEFWVIMVSSYVFIALSISLSTMKKQ